MEANPIYHLKSQIASLNIKIEEIETDTKDLITRVDKLEGLEGKIDSTIESMEGGLKSNGEEITGLKSKIKFIESILSRMGGKSDRGCMLMAEQADMSSMGGMGPPPGSGPPPAGILGKGVVLGIARSDYLHENWKKNYPKLIKKIKEEMGGEGAFVADEDLKKIIIKTLQEEEENGNPIASPEHFEQEKDTLIPKIIDKYIRQITETYKKRGVEEAAGGGGKRRKKSKSKKKKKSKNRKKKGKSKRKRSKRR